MTVPERRRLKKAGWAIATTFAVMAAVILPSNPVSADVDTVAGSAYGASVNSSLLGPVLPPTPGGVAGSASEPVDTYGPIQASALPISIPGLLSLAVINASTAGGGVAAAEPAGHLGFAASEASLAGLAVGPNAITAQAVEVDCSSNGDGSTGSTALTNAFLGATPLLATPLANTVVEVPGVLTAVINEQIINNAPGATSITVNGLHITLLPSPLLGTALLDIIIGHVECSATGPDVLTTTTPPTTAPPSTTEPPVSTTQPPVSTTQPPVSTTQPPTVSTTSTSTTTPPTITGSTASPATTTTTRVVTGGLARTGTSGMRVMVILAFLLVVLGSLIRMGTRGLAPDNLVPAGSVANLPPWAQAQVLGQGYAFPRPIQRPVHRATAAPDRWGPSEIARAVGFGFVALAVGALKALVPEGKRRRRR